MILRDFFCGMGFTLAVIGGYVVVVFGLVAVLGGLVGVASAAPYQCRTYGYSGETFTSCGYDDSSGHHHTTTTCNQWGCTTRQDS